MERAVGHSFDVDTAVEPAGNGTYRATLTDRWNGLTGQPLGGYSLAVCMSALTREVERSVPLVISAFFLRPVVAGEAQLQAEAIREGRRVSTGEVSLIQDGKERVRVLATYAEPSAGEGRTLMLNEPPRLPPPEASVDPLDGGSIPGISITERVEFRMANPPGWMQGTPTGAPESEMWVRFREPREPDLASLALLVDAAAPAVLEIGELGSQTLELTIHLRAKPAPGWLGCRIATRHLIDGYHEEDCEIWDSSGRLVAQSRQLAALPGPGSPEQFAAGA